MSVEIALRIPGTWDHPRRLSDRLPDGCRLNRNHLVMPDKSTFEIFPHPADKEFPSVFARACRQLPTESEREQVENYTVNVCLAGPGGSFTAARQIMAAAAALIRAGGAGVFIDNSALAHGGRDWLALAHEENRETGPLRAYVTVVRSGKEVYSVGMHVLGHRDVVLPYSGDDRAAYDAVFRFLNESCGQRTVRDGDVYTDPVLSKLRVQHEPAVRFPRHLPTHNPFGQWRLVQ